jgi:hypothetical protein
MDDHERPLETPGVPPTGSPEPTEGSTKPSPVPGAPPTTDD